MPKIALAKVAKKIRKKRGALDNLGDREAARYNRAALREQKLKKNAKTRNGMRDIDMVRTGYFKVAVKDVTAPLEVAQIRELIENWVHRDDHELERYEQERRPGRPPLPKHMDLKNRVEREMEEFVTGFHIPDLQDWQNIENLQRWDGTIGSLAQVRFTRVTKEGSSITTNKMEM
ncbi:hypothetical protein K440DRAFT_594429 [Wilcoxina mikolae CBS 423.85]|nr:hypothetical protein K440DRAFT_594429 [Wilcoxina mikolae CBS 423.85]